MISIAAATMADIRQYPPSVHWLYIATNSPIAIIVLRPFS
jgi:hypothetical protein